MRERLQAIGVWVVWLGGFATGVQYLAAGGALVIAAFVFLLRETPLSFRVALFVGLFLIAFAALSYLIRSLLSSPVSPNADTNAVGESRSESAPRPLRSADALEQEWREWRNAPKTQVIGKTYRNERVELDGHHFINCKFINATYVFRGTASFNIDGSKFEGSTHVDILSPQTQLFVALLKELGHLDPGIDVSDSRSYDRVEP